MKPRTIIRKGLFTETSVGLTYRSIRNQGLPVDDYLISVEGTFYLRMFLIVYTKCILDRKLTSSCMIFTTFSSINRSVWNVESCE